MRVLIVAVALGFGGALAGGAAEQAGEQELHEIMQSGAEDLQSMPMTGELDHDFVWALKKHHQNGIAMARVVLKYGSDPRARELAKKIVENETREMGELDRWMAKHHQPMK